MFAHSTWGIYLADLATGEVLIDQAGGKSLVPGSIMKVYSTATALDSLGPDYRFRTPVYRLGKVDDGVLAGDLVLVASGDFSFGLRDQADGTLAFNSLPELDHNYADTGIPGGALVKGGDPLAALDDLAAQVKAAGIREIGGNVMVDDRLFETYRGFPDGLIAPIWVNENVIDITTTATKPGEKAKVDWRPKSAAIAVEADVATVAAGGKPITVKMLRPGVIGVSGEVAAGSPPILSIAPISEPAAFARTAFIEALVRAGIKVAAAPLGAPAALPDRGSYADADKVAEHVSPPLSEYVKVILKISYNRGADLMVCLAAVKAGSRNCADGLTQILKLLGRHGLAESGTYVFDGAGSDDGGKTTPADLATFLREIIAEPSGPLPPRRPGGSGRRWHPGSERGRHAGSRTHPGQGRRPRRRKCRRPGHRPRQYPGRLYRRQKRAQARLWRVRQQHAIHVCRRVPCQPGRRGGHRDGHPAGLLTSDRRQPVRAIRAG